jgi:hypothetical protein
MIRFTHHAETMLVERGIEREWVERVLTAPLWRETDPNNPALKRAFGDVAEAGGKILRVVYSDDPEPRIVTVFFDARAKRPMGSSR